MKLTLEEEQRLLTLLEEYIHNPKVLEMQRYIQHGAVTTYEHCHNVTRVSYWINKRFHLGADEDVLIAGAFLHDFYLYDWHDTSVNWHRLHGFRHPEFARRNAENYFHIGKRVQAIIRSHMWPLTITKLPTSREAIIVCIADKYVSSVETLGQRKGSKRICG